MFLSRFGSIRGTPRGYAWLVMLWSLVVLTSACGDEALPTGDGDNGGEEPATALSGLILDVESGLPVL